MKVRTEGWKFRKKGEFAHYFSPCRHADCQSCDEGTSHAMCGRGIVAGWYELPSFSKSRPPHKACAICSDMIEEQARIRNLPWRERARLKLLRLKR